VHAFDAGELAAHFDTFWKSAGRWHISDECPIFMADQSWNIWYKVQSEHQRLPEPLCDRCAAEAIYATLP
jgi:hypothetical protein